MSQEFKNRTLTSVILLLSMTAMFFSNFVFVFFLIIFLTISIVEFLNITNIIHKNYFIKIISNFLFISYVFILFSILLQFSIFYNLKIIVFTILLICVSSDIGGYVFGKKFSGPKLTKISPNKTIAGCIGALFLSSLMSVILISYLINEITFKSFLLGIIISVGVQIGDLLFSYLKRRASLKDTGNILPGHGGVLDRIDGIIIGMPLGLIFFLMIH